MYERLTDRARKVMQLANQEARRLSHNYVGSEHILIGLVKEGFGVGVNVLKNLGVDPGKVMLDVHRMIHAAPAFINLDKLSLTPGARRIIDQAVDESAKLKHDHVGTEHILLGIFGVEGVAATVLTNLGVTYEKALEETMRLVGTVLLADAAAAAEEVPDRRSCPFKTAAEAIAHIRDELGPANEGSGGSLTQSGWARKMAMEELDRLNQLIEASFAGSPPPYPIRLLLERLEKAEMDSERIEQFDNVIRNGWGTVLMTHLVAKREQGLRAVLDAFVQEHPALAAYQGQKP